MNLRSLCLAILAAYSFSGTTFTHGSAYSLTGKITSLRTIAAQALLKTSPKKLSIIALAHDICPKEQRVPLFKKIVAEHELLSVWNTNDKPKGPLFSHFTIKHLPLTFDVIKETKPKNVQEMLHQLVHFTAQEYRKNNLVLHHGQGDIWAFFEKIFNKSLHIKEGGLLSEPVRHRLREKPLVPDEELALLIGNGITYETLGRYRQNVSFCNLHPLANHDKEGSNSLSYVLNNYDQTTLNYGNFSSGHNTLIDLDIKMKTTFQNILLTLFTELNMEKEFKQLEDQDPQVFYRLYSLYKAEVIARGNRGSLIVTSLPKSIASELCYPALPGGRLIKPVVINGTPTTNIVSLFENFDETEFENQCNLLLLEKVLTIKQRDAAGITVQRLTPTPTEESKEYAEGFEAEFTKIMNRIAEFYKERMAKEGKSS